MENSFISEEKILGFYLGLLYLSVIPGIIGIAQKICAEWFNITLIKRLIYSTPELDGRIYSTFSNPNIAGGWFAAMLLIAVFFWSRKEFKHRWILGLMMLLYSINLMLTGSRGAIMGLAAASIVFLVIKNGWRKLVIPGALLLIMLILSLIPSDGSFISSLMGHALSSSFDSRYPIWKGSIEMIFEKPMLGWGLMGIYEKGALFFYKTDPVFHAHNIWLSILSTLGLAGFYVYLVMKAYIIYGLGMLKKANCSLTPLLASIQVLVIVHGFVDCIICVPQTGILFITCSAFIASLSRSFSTTPNLQQLPAEWTGMFSKYRAD
jgi:O-antigen ligase